MKRRIVAVLVILMNVTPMARAEESLHWKKDMASGINESVIKRISSSEYKELWIATNKALYSKKFNSTIYQMRLRLPAAVTSVNDLHLANGGETVYAATDQGLYQSVDGGKHWQKIYTMADESMRQALSVIELGDQIFLGTKEGLLWRNIDETTWQYVSSTPKDPIYKLKEFNGVIYALTLDRVFEIDVETMKSKEIYRQGIQVAEAIEETGSDVDDEARLQNKSIHELSFDPSSQVFILITSQGILKASGPKMAWEHFTDLPVLASTITSIILLPSASHGQCAGGDSRCLPLLLSSKKGAYQLTNGRWVAVNGGLFDPSINDLSVDHDDIYAATDYGVYFLNQEKSNAEGNHEINMNLNEPTINQVHAWTIDYAEVSNDKIKQWRSLAKKQALLPSLNMGIDGGRDWNRGDSIFGSSSSGGTHYIAPDDKSSGQDIGFDIGLSWDLGDYIWSTDQTTIDSRGKMMVELRETLLSQVTQLYFERRRLQIELQKAEDEQETFDIEMRIMEITALLDASTGGKFSEKQHIN